MLLKSDLKCVVQLGELRINTSREDLVRKRDIKYCPQLVKYFWPP